MKLNKIVKVKRKKYIDNDKVSQWYKDGWNACKKEYDSKEICVDREKLAEVIKQRVDKTFDYTANVYMSAETIANTIADNLEKVLKVKE